MRRIILAAAAALCSFAMTAPEKASAQDFWIGQIVLGGWNFCPRTTLPAAGQLLAISSNTALFSLYGTNYGGDGRTTFGLPDLRGTAAVSTGNRPGLSFYQLGSFRGAEQHTLNILEMPSHNHQIQNTVTSALFAETGASTAATAADNLLANEAAGTYSTDGRGALNAMADDAIDVSVSSTALNNGGSQPFPILGPRLALQYCVVQFGIFPSRS